MKTTCCPAYTIKYVLDIVLNIWLLNSIEDDRLDGLIGSIHAHLIICTWNLRTRSIKLLLSELSIQPSSVLGHCLVTFSGTGFNSWGRQLMLSAILYQGTTRRVFYEIQINLSRIPLLCISAVHVVSERGWGNIFVHIFAVVLPPWPWFHAIHWNVDWVY